MPIEIAWARIRNNCIDCCPNAKLAKIIDKGMSIILKIHHIVLIMGILSANSENKAKMLSNPNCQIVWAREYFKTNPNQPKTKELLNEILPITYKKWYI